MNRRLSREEFIILFDVIWESGPKVKYQNPDRWTRYLMKN